MWKICVEILGKSFEFCWTHKKSKTRTILNQKTKTAMKIGFVLFVNYGLLNPNSLRYQNS